MRAVIQRVSQASVAIGEEQKSKIGQGLLIFLGIGKEDGEEDVQWLSQKISKLRIFNDDEGKMNLSVNEVDGAALVISQFTLHAKTKKGTRPSYIRAAVPEVSIPLYEKFVTQFEKDIGKKVGTGEFGAEMKVDLTNDGPVTIIIDTKNKDL